MSEHNPGHATKRARSEGSADDPNSHVKVQLQPAAAAPAPVLSKIDQARARLDAMRNKGKQQPPAATTTTTATTTTISTTQDASATTITQPTNSLQTLPPQPPQPQIQPSSQLDGPPPSSSLSSSTSPAPVPKPAEPAPIQDGPRKTIYLSVKDARGFVPAGFTSDGRALDEHGNFVEILSEAELAKRRAAEKRQAQIASTMEGLDDNRQGGSTPASHVDTMTDVADDSTSTTTTTSTTALSTAAAPDAQEKSLLTSDVPPIPARRRIRFGIDAVPSLAPTATPSAAALRNAEEVKLKRIKARHQKEMENDVNDAENQYGFCIDWKNDLWGKSVRVSHPPPPKVLHHPFQKEALGVEWWDGAIMRTGSAYQHLAAHRSTLVAQQHPHADHTATTSGGGDAASVAPTISPIILAYPPSTASTPSILPPSLVVGLDLPSHAAAGTPTPDVGATDALASDDTTMSDSSHHHHDSQSQSGLITAPIPDPHTIRKLKTNPNDVREFLTHWPHQLVGPETVSTLIYHPRPLAPIIRSDEREIIQKTYLTTKEMKKQRKADRQQKQQHRRTLVKAGIIPPPPPKIRLSNLHRVMEHQQVTDVTQFEQEVRQQLKDRIEKHITHNLEKMLTDEERREKRKRKLKEERDLIAKQQEKVTAVVYRVGTLGSAKNRKNILLNAKQLYLSGFLLLSEHGNMIYVEGGERGIKKFDGVVARRLTYVNDTKFESFSYLDEGLYDDDDDNDEGNTANATGVDQQSNPSGDDGTPASKPAHEGKYVHDPNYGHSPHSDCVTIWRGTVSARIFQRFGTFIARNPHHARSIFKQYGIESYYDIGKQYF